MLGDLFNFAKFHAGDVWDQIKDSPERMFLGAADPLGSKMWGGILGKDWDPMVNPFGGATDDQFNRADAEGLNTGPSRVMGGIADTIAGIYGGAGVASGFGNAFGGLGGSGGGGFMGQVDTGGVQGQPLGFMNQVDTQGVPGGFMGQVDTGGVQGGGFDIQSLMRMAQQMPGGGQQQHRQQPPPPPMMNMQQAKPIVGMPQVNNSANEWLRSRRNMPQLGPLGRSM